MLRFESSERTQDIRSDRIASHRENYGRLVGSCAVMRQLYERIEAAAWTRSTVLIVGESGTGKELVARALHERSKRGPFVPFNCAALPKDLIESELFGHKRGAFSGANNDYLGLFRSADGGTLFLDEITEMAPETQAKLLRTLQEHTVRPVGSVSEIPLDVRVIASTNRNSEEAVRAGLLRQDLYYRLQVNVLTVPPLRERRSDIPALVDHFIDLYNSRSVRDETRVDGIEFDALRILMEHEWPGNVRELGNAIESAFTFGRTPIIGIEDLPPTVIHQRNAIPAKEARGDSLDESAGSSVKTFAEAECELICHALERTSGNKVQAAKLLNISRKKLYAKIDRYRIESGSGAIFAKPREIKAPELPLRVGENAERRLCTPRARSPYVV